MSLFQQLNPVKAYASAQDAYSITEITENYTFEGISQKLHLIIQSEYSLMQVLGEKEYDDAMVVLLEQWVNINPQDMLHHQVIDHLAKLYCEDGVFRARWSTISARFSAWLQNQAGQTPADFSKMLYDVIVFKDQLEQDILPAVLFTTRVETIDESLAVQSDELFWINCFMLSRLTLEHSFLIAEYKRKVRENETSSIKRKTT